jgi:hypothetical protein
MINSGVTALHSWNFGLAVSYLEGDRKHSLFASKKLSEIQLWSGVTVFKEKDAAALL